MFLNVLGREVKRGKFWLGILLSILSGLMLLWAFPPHNYWFLIYFAMIPYLLAQYRLLPIELSSIPPALMLGVWLQPYLYDLFGPGVPWFLAYLGSIIAIINLLVKKERRFHENTKYRYFIIHGVFDWVGFEMIRSFIPMLGTNAFIANTQASQPWLIQPIAVFSIYGLGLLIMFINFTLALGVLAAYDKKQGQSLIDLGLTRRWLIVVGVMVMAWGGTSYAIFAAEPEQVATIKTAVLQPNYPLPAHLDFTTPKEDRKNTILTQAYQAAEAGAELIVTPEMVLGFNPQTEFTDDFLHFVEDTGAYIFISYTHTTNEIFHNDSVLLTPDGEFLAVYGKNHPFGEPRSPNSGNYYVYDSPWGLLSIQICHDANFTDVSRKLANHGALMSAVATREFGTFAEQAWTHYIMRAVETRTAIAHAGVAYGSTIIDPYGRIIEQALTPEGERLILVANLPLVDQYTPFLLLGDWLGWFSLTVYIYFMFSTKKLESKFGS